jgi:hypothetical protein
MRRSFVSCVVAATLAFTGFSSTTLVSSAVADRTPDKVFAGKILTSDKKFPSSAKSSGAYIAALRKQNKSTFMEDKAKQSWKIHFAAFFKKGLSDIEVTVKLYDVSNGSKNMMASFEQYVDERGQTALLSQFTLERKLVGVNKQVMIVLEVGGKSVAAGRFKILGEEEHLSGKVNFSDDDTHKSDDDD